MPHISERNHLFFGLHFILGMKLVIWESDNLFFLLHFILDKELDICAGVSNHPPNLEKWQKMVNFTESSPLTAQYKVAPLGI